MTRPPFNNACAAGQNPQHKPACRPINAPGCFDVIGGRGQGVQRLPGNMTYRALVSANKRIYASCHRNDKYKVCKAIVAAIREIGGRFLDYDEESQTYREIGDKRALSKTSQALREGLVEIRRQIYSERAEGRFDANCLGSFNATLPAERYFDYSIRVLESLTKNAENAAS